MNRIVIQEGYTLPFDGARRKRRKSSSGLRRQQTTMKACARKWKGSGRKGSYRSFMKRCLKK